MGLSAGIMLHIPVPESLDQGADNPRPGRVCLPKRVKERDFRGESSLPFDGGRWFGGNVVDDAVDAWHLVDNTVGDASQ